MKKSKIISSLAAFSLLFTSILPLTACAQDKNELVLRVANWEQYIDLGKWGEDERIEIDNAYGDDGVIGVNKMVDDFTEWFNSSDYGFTVKVEYSTFGTNEDLYNRLNLGDQYDLVCPSDYMIMKLLADEKNPLEPYSESFRDTSIETNYYANYVSPFIDNVFQNSVWADYAAGYMWGVTGLVYNPEIVDLDDVKSWEILQNENYARRVTIKDNVRDSYFPALGILNREDLTSDEITSAKRDELLNDTSDEAIAAAEDILKNIKENVYSFETDSGKADMITGKVAVNYQWSGDGVYIMDEAESDRNNPTELWFSVPDECTNLWFDGWVMLKNGINGSNEKKIAAEAFVNYLSRPDNAIRNMYTIGYTSAIAGDMIFDYLNYNYGVDFDMSSEYYDEEITEICAYDLSHFFGKLNSSEAPILYIDAAELEVSASDAEVKHEKLGEKFGNDKDYTVYYNAKIDRGRQAFTQYPPENVIARSVVMIDFGDRLADINSMWINVRCLDVKDFNPAAVWITISLIVIIATAITLFCLRYKLFFKSNEQKSTTKKDI